MKWETHGYLDVRNQDGNNDAGFWGDAILIRDNDGMGFGLLASGLDAIVGKHVRITIEEVPAHDLRSFPTETEQKDGKQTPYHLQKALEGVA